LHADNSREVRKRNILYTDAHTVSTSRRTAIAAVYILAQRTNQKTVCHNTLYLIYM